MATTTTYALRYPVLGDAPNGPAGFQNLAEDVETRGLNVPVFAAVQTVVQNIANNVYTSITFTAEQIDTHGGHSTTTNTSRWTCPTGWAGYYAVSGLVYFSTGTVGIRSAALAKNGTRFVGSSSRLQPCADGFGDGVPTATRVILLAVGDYVELQGLQNNGGTVATFASATESSSFDVQFIRRA